MSPTDSALLTRGPLPEDHRGLSVVTLGVAAGPAIRGRENGIATAIVVDDVHYLVDFGLGCTRAAHEANLRGRSLRAAFITHLHSDHVAELPAYLLWNWGTQVDGFTRPVDLVGPGTDPALDGLALAGTAGLIDGVLDAYSYDIHIRVGDEGRPVLRDLIHVREMMTPSPGSAEIFPVYEDDRVRVTATLVEHPPVFPAVAFRFDTEHGSVTLSGDTTECESLAVLARDTDVLVHEAVNLAFYRGRGFPDAFVRHQEISHATPEGAGRIATQAGARALILSHLAGPAEPSYWAEAASATYSGPVETAWSGAVHRVTRS
ncbi:MAG: MBL fold metallo-hydrolase [Propionibacteriaceae bacterium]|nr:MBL fold metallo-hydrolase [Propionibacteriaceae bacterium]